MPAPGLLLAAPAPPPLGDDEIHVWFCEIDAVTTPQRRRAAQGFLRQRLAAYCSCDAGELVVETGEHGKPVLAGAAFAFNLSHSGNRAALALARGTDIGIDIEVPTRPRAHRELAGRYFCAREADAIAAADENERERLFLRLWTAKEAVLKALGRGLAFGLDRLEFDPAAAAPVLLRIAPDGGNAGDWQVHALPLTLPAIGHVAWRGGDRRLRFFRDAMQASSTPQECY